MLKLIGVCLLTGGASGFSFCLCRERKKRLFLLKEIRYMYQLIQNEILYTGLPLPEIFKSLAGNLAEPIASSLRDIGESMTLSQEKSFHRIWQDRMQEGLLESTLTKKQKEAVLRLPEILTLSACDGQVKALDRQIEETERLIRQMEEEEKSKNKVIMSLGIAAGIFLSVLLL